VWIDADTHRQFLSEILEDPDIQVEHPGGAMWAIKGRSWSVQATSMWGTERMPGPALAKAVLEQRPIQVTDETDEGRRIVNPTETAAAQEKAQALQERFSEWCWQDPDRARRLAGEYNRRFNAIVLRDYSTEGERLTLPGLPRTFQPRAHQRAAVARMLAEPAPTPTARIRRPHSRSTCAGPREAPPNARAARPRERPTVPQSEGRCAQQRRLRRAIGIAGRRHDRAPR
jgi:N12 class adenine-specific DNA methylase